MEQIDVVVVGAGVVGLASAMTIAERGRSVCVLDRRVRPGMETSTHNSGVIHAGLYYPAGTLKTTLCVEGRPLLYAFCQRHAVPHVRCGKLIVATEESDVPHLESLRASGAANGIDSDQWARQNNLLGSAELTVAGPSRWQHRFTGFEYSHQRTNVDVFADPGRVFDFPTHAIADINRAGFEYQGDYQARSWARTTVGYQFEDENGFVGDLDFPPLVHGLRLNHAVYGQQLLTLGRVSLVLGARFVHNQTFGNKAVPRAALSLQVLKGGAVFSGTQLRFSYATGIKEPRLEESFARGQGIIPNPDLKAEENRAFEAGLQQSFFGGKYAFTATYYNNLFRNQIDFAILDPVTFTGQYENIDKSIAHGAELELHARPWSRLSLDAGYNYTSTQILQQPFAFDPLHEPGQPLLRRPRHSGSLLLTWLGSRWGGNLGGSFVGRRPDSDFSGFGITHAAGYARVDVGGWYALNSRMTAYVNVENVLDKRYNEVVGYPALGANFRAGMRFRLGGE